MFTSPIARLVLGKVTYAAACLLAAVLLVVSGYAHKVVGLTTQLATGAMIGHSPSIGAMNVLVMGLESRTNFYGQEIDHHQQVVLNSGSGGAQDTDTLILIHIFAGGQRAVGFSIPRDSVVTYPRATFDGIASGKIDEAYDWAYNLSEQNTSTTSMSLTARAHLANQAGELFEVKTVEELTGLTINHFIESNLIGFYSLAQEFGGLEVCIKPAPAQAGFAAGANLTDYDPQTGTDNSGFNAYTDGYNKVKGGAQYLHLSAAQSLAYIRSRDTLPGVDIGRTARQQAAIDYVVYELKHGNYFSDIGKLTAILGSASNFLVTDQNFDLLDFATNMRALTGKDLKLTTLPGTPQNNVPEPGFPSGQDILNINVSRIRQLVRNAFYPQPAVPKTASGVAKTPGTTKKAASAPAASTVTVDVYNGSTASTAPLAGQTSAALVALGYKAGAVLNASAQSQVVEAGTQVFYGAGASANAAKVATAFGTTAIALTSLPAEHVEVLIGSASTAVPAALTPSTSSTASTQAVGARLIGTQVAVSSAAKLKSAPSGSQSGSNGGPTTVAPSAQFGISHCVY